MQHAGGNEFVLEVCEKMMCGKTNTKKANHYPVICWHLVNQKCGIFQKKS